MIQPSPHHIHIHIHTPDCAAAKIYHKRKGTLRTFWML